MLQRKKNSKANNNNIFLFGSINPLSLSCTSVQCIYSNNNLLRTRNKAVDLYTLYNYDINSYWLTNESH